MLSLPRLWPTVCAYLFAGYRGLGTRGKSKSFFPTLDCAAVSQPSVKQHRQQARILPGWRERYMRPTAIGMQSTAEHRVGQKTTVMIKEKADPVGSEEICLPTQSGEGSIFKIRFRWPRTN